jgi:shikimate dehydrogenase
MFYQLGLVGHPVEHSLSPTLHKAALEYFELQGDYQLIDVLENKIESAIADIVSRDFVGFNVTIPHKQAFFGLCAELTPEARECGAVNTVKINNGRLLGHNTDVGGFITALSRKVDATIDGGAACVVGTGGSARAAVCGLIKSGWKKIEVVARNVDAAEEMIAAFKKSHSGTQFEASPLERSRGLTSIPDVLVNCTPVGLRAEDELPDWAETLLRWTNPRGTFFDMVYTRNGKTVFQKEAHRLRLNYVTGEDMLVEQAALAFEFWTGRSGAVGCMRQALALQKSVGSGKQR